MYVPMYMFVDVVIGVRLVLHMLLSEQLNAFNLFHDTRLETNTSHDYLPVMMLIYLQTRIEFIPFPASSFP